MKKSGRFIGLPLWRQDFTYLFNQTDNRQVEASLLKVACLFNHLYHPKITCKAAVSYIGIG